jgi:RNA 3'-phosphate cyclase
MIRVDGSLGEGGGHSLRTALCLAALTRQETEIVNIRRSRRAPGMRPELIAAARATAEISGGRLEGDTLNSQAVHFWPGALKSGEFEVAVDTAAGGNGAVAPIVVSLLPLLANAPGSSELVATGATHVPHTTTATYLQTVVAPSLRKIGLQCEITTERWGWAPNGRGVVRARVSRSVLHGKNLTERGQMLQLGGISVASNMEPGYAERLKNRAVRRLAEVGRGADLQTQAVPAETKGAMLFLLAVFERAIAGFSAVSLGDRTAEETADDAISQLFDYQTKYVVFDRQLGEHLLLFAALAEGRTEFSVSEVTIELLTSAALVRQFLGAKVSIEGAKGEAGEVRVTGAGPLDV